MIALTFQIVVVLCCHLLGEIVLTLPRDLARIWPYSGDRARLRPIRGVLDRIWSEVGHCLPRVCQMWAIAGQIWPGVGRMSAMSHDLGPDWARIQPKCSEFGRMWPEREQSAVPRGQRQRGSPHEHGPNIGRDLVEIGQTCPKPACNWSKSNRDWLTSANLGAASPKFAEIWPKLGRRWPKLALEVMPKPTPNLSNPIESKSTPKRIRKSGRSGLDSARTWPNPDQVWPTSVPLYRLKLSTASRNVVEIDKC